MRSLHYGNNAVVVLCCSPSLPLVVNYLLSIGSVCNRLTLSSFQSMGGQQWKELLGNHHPSTERHEPIKDGQEHC